MLAKDKDTKDTKYTEDTKAAEKQVMDLYNDAFAKVKEAIRERDRERDLANCFDAMQVKQDEIERLLANIGKSHLLSEVTASELGKRLTITKGRAAELRDLAKDRKRGNLHSNPAKLARVLNDLNEDLEECNKLKGGIDDARKQEFEAKIKEQLCQVKPLLPDGVPLSAINIDARVKTLIRYGKDHSWADFDNLWKTFLKDCAEAGREKFISRLQNSPEFNGLNKSLKQKVTQSLSEKSLSWQDAKTILSNAVEQSGKEAKPENQQIPEFPPKSLWEKKLDLKVVKGVGYRQVTPFDSYKVHFTMSNDAWTELASGKLAIDSDTAKIILRRLLKVDPTKQAHTTLELGTLDMRPHIYMYDYHHNTQNAKWENAAILHFLKQQPDTYNNEDKAEWIVKAKNHLIAEIDKVREELEKKVAEFQAEYEKQQNA